MPKLESTDTDIPFWFLFIWSLLLAVLTSVVALALSSIQWLQTAALIIWVAFFFMPFLGFIELFEEIGIPGIFAMKTRRGITTIQQRLVQNKVVQIVEINETRLFWIDDSKVPHRLLDIETAQFLARQEGILEIDANELKQLKPIAPMDFPRITSAIPKRDGGTIFILYNDTLYYQSSLGFLYKLATLQGFDFKGIKKSIADGGWDDWIQPLQPEDFNRYKVV